VVNVQKCMLYPVYALFS